MTFVELLDSLSVEEIQERMELNELSLTSKRARARAEVRAVTDEVIKRWAKGAQIDDQEYTVDEMRDELIRLIDGDNMEFVSMILKEDIAKQEEPERDDVASASMHVMGQILGDLSTLRGDLEELLTAGADDKKAAAINSAAKSLKDAFNTLLSVK